MQNIQKINALSTKFAIDENLIMFSVLQTKLLYVFGSHRQA